MSEAVHEILERIQRLPAAERLLLEEQLTEQTEAEWQREALDARRAAAVALLEGWAKQDESLSAQELAGNAAVLKAVDDDRPSFRKLFTGLLEEPK